MGCAMAGSRASMLQGESMLRLASAFAITLLAASSAWAADEGGYIGGGFGNASLTSCQEFTSTQGSTCGSSTAVRIFGGYAFNRVFAIEAGFSDFGSIGTAFELSGVVSLPFTERFAL